jgi:hypothetical protein
MCSYFTFPLLAALSGAGCKGINKHYYLPLLVALSVPSYKIICSYLYLLLSCNTVLWKDHHTFRTAIKT